MSRPNTSSRALRRAAISAVALCLAAGPTAALAADPGPQVVSLVFARKGADPNVAVRVERDLRNMFAFARTQPGGEAIARPYPVELRFDVGNISKGEVTKSRRHFNDAQRALEKGDSEEALEQLFRAQRFYNKGIPYASDTALLRGIFFYYYLARKAAGQTKRATDDYCAYVGLTRNLAGSAGPIEQFEPLADKCGETTVAGTAELRVRANVDGAHVYVDDRAVGVIGKEMPYIAPFISAGPHLVEVRKAGYARWGQLVVLRNGKSQGLRARLKSARNRKDEFTPLAELVFEGDEAFSENYIADLMFQMADRYGVDELVVGYVEPKRRRGMKLTLFSFMDGAVETSRFDITADRDGHGAALSSYWKSRFGQALDPADALPSEDRFAPTLFKVE